MLCYKNNKISHLKSLCVMYNVALEITIVAVLVNTKQCQK